MNDLSNMMTLQQLLEKRDFDYQGDPSNQPEPTEFKVTKTQMLSDIKCMDPFNEDYESMRRRMWHKHHAKSLLGGPNITLQQAYSELKALEARPELWDE